MKSLSGATVEAAEARETRELAPFRVSRGGLKGYLGFRVLGGLYRVLGFRVQGLGVWVSEFWGFRVIGFSGLEVGGFRVQGELLQKSQTPGKLSQRRVTLLTVMMIVVMTMRDITWAMAKMRLKITQTPKSMMTLPATKMTLTKLVYNDYDHHARWFRYFPYCLKYLHDYDSAIVCH